MSSLVSIPVEEEIKYLNLCEFINQNITQIQIIKEKYLGLLSNLTPSPMISTELFVDTITRISNSNMLIIISYVGNIQDQTNKDNFQIIGSGTVFIEPKLIRGASNVAHIEDIVVDPNFRGKKIAHSILSTLKLFAIKNSCYKVILDCDSKLQEFYEKNDFEVKQIQMGKYF